MSKELESELLTQDQYCQLRKISRRTSYNERLLGYGPPFVKPAGTRLIYYRRVDVDAWLRERTFPHYAAAAVANKAA